MTERLELLGTQLNALLRQHRAAQAEIRRLSRALSAAEKARDKALSMADAANAETNIHALAVLSAAVADKPQLRKTLDAVIAEIDSILMQLHD